MKLETPIIAMVLASLFLVGIWGFFSSVADDYAEAGYINRSLGMQVKVNNETVSLTNTFDYINQSQEAVEGIQEDFGSLKGDLTDLGRYLGIASKTAKLLYDNLIGMQHVLDDMSQLLGIDMKIGTTLFIILLVSFIVAIIVLLAGRFQ